MSARVHPYHRADDGTLWRGIVRCRLCGRRPKHATGYDDMKGCGPYFIACYHGVRSESVFPEYIHNMIGPKPGFVLSRSWDRRRATRNWRRLNAPENQ